MKFTEEFERLNNLVDEIKTLCDTTDKETEKINQETEELIQYEWLMFCTELAPYWEIARKTNRIIIVDTGVLSGWADYKYYIVFSERHIVLKNWKTYSFTIADRNYTELLFYSYDDIKRKYSFCDDNNNAYAIAKQIDWNVFRKSFAEQIEKALTDMAKIANENREYALKKLNELKQ